MTTPPLLEPEVRRQPSVRHRMQRGPDRSVTTFSIRRLLDAKEATHEDTTGHETLSGRQDRFNYWQLCRCSSRSRPVAATARRRGGALQKGKKREDQLDHAVHARGNDDKLIAVERAAAWPG